jgi:DNA-binding CsgD family transcriptional regulator
MIDDRWESMKPSESSSADGSFAKTILNSLSAHVAILDANGVILESNRAWKRFAKSNQIRIRPDTLGINYLEICEQAGNEPSLVAGGIREVITGKREEFAMEYDCHSPDEQRWFYMRVTRTPAPGPMRIVVSHENITALKRAEAALKSQKRHLEEANTALKVLLRQREDDQHEMEKNILDNMQHLVAPVLARLAATRLRDRQKDMLASLEERLSELTRPFMRRLSAIESRLTPQEIEVAALIREGRRSKEIADHLGLSIATVNFHRRNLRRKLDLRNTSTNLRSFLLGLNH